MILLEHTVSAKNFASQLSRPKVPLFFSLQLFSSSLYRYLHSTFTAFSSSIFNFSLQLQTMPDLANLSISDSVTVTHCPNLKSLSATDPPDQSLVKTLGVDCDSDQRMGFATLQNGEVKNGAGTSNGKSLEDHVRVWVANRKELGIPETRSALPFLCGTKKLVQHLLLVLFFFLVAEKIGEEKQDSDSFWNLRK